MTDFIRSVRLLQRRQFLGPAGRGAGAVALSSPLAPSVAGGDKPRRPPGLHYPAKAKRVIFLCMAGGPSHLETFDSKPALAEMHGKPMPESFTKGQPIAQL